MVRSLDESVGRVLAQLKKRGLEQNTIVVFTSDNGGYIGNFTHEGRAIPVTDNSPLRSGKGTLYEGGLRVPLIVKWPGVTPAGMDCDTPVVLTDLFHTLVAATGLSKPADLPPDGLELSPLLRNPNATARSRRALLSLPALLSRSAFHARQRRAAGDWKLVEFFEDERVELYNLA